MATNRLRRWKHRLVRSFLYNLPLAIAAAVWRRLLVRTTFIAITGSNGKTTTKELLAAILAARHPVHKTRSSHNGRHGLIRTILAARPWHRYAVVEIGVEAPGQMWRAAWLTRPEIAIITGVAREHSENFPTLEATAAEKARLLGGLKRNGVAVLNGDDPRVRQMRTSGGHRSYCFYFYGTDPSFDLWADNIGGRWPERLRMRVHSGGDARWVATKLVGPHWAPAVLAALLAGRLCGVDLDESLKVIARLDPFTARLEPVELPGGAVLVRDEFNGSAGTTRVALQLLAQARAGRRIAILSDVTDDDRPTAERLFELGRLAAASADLAVFVGANAHYAAQGAKAAGLLPVRTFEHVREAAAWLRTETAPGDLILLKGRNRDHLSRIFLDLITPVTCWRDVCEYRHLCDECSELGPRPPRGGEAKARGF
jgi:UDP-N-acetylmuramoyl-tripeptide--D-alanyl-D-alanine ligase